jgi:hypothetical protein
MADPTQDMLDALRESVRHLQQLDAGLTAIDRTLTGGALAGGPGDLLIEALHDRTIFGVIQMGKRLGELAAELETIGGERPDYSSDPSLAAFYQPFVQFLPGALFSAEEQTAMLNLIRMLPAGLSQSLLLECRLQQNVPQIDLSLRVDPALDRGRELLANWPASGDQWDRVREFCAAWADPSSPLNKGVATAWLEFDLDKESGSLLPSLFFTHRTDVLLRPGVNETFTSPELTVVEAALDALLGVGVKAALRDQAMRCHAALPMYAGIRWIGAMLSRRGGGIRLCIEMLHEQIPEFLDKIGAGDVGKYFVEHTDPYMKQFDVPVLAIELTENGIGPRIGAECRYFKQRQPEIEPRWSAVLKMLTQDGSCDPAKADAVLNWGGYSYARLSAKPPQVFTRSLSHIKVQTQPDAGVEAKVYLACIARPVNLDKFRTE